MNRTIRSYRNRYQPVNNAFNPAVISAKFSSKCPLCDGQVIPGSMIKWVRGDAAKHLACAAKESVDSVMAVMLEAAPDAVDATLDGMSKDTTPFGIACYNEAKEYVAKRRRN